MSDLWLFIRNVLAVIGAIWLLSPLVIAALLAWLWWTGQPLAEEFVDADVEARAALTET